MEEKRKYRKPELKSRALKLGVFGDYGGDGSSGGEVVPHPIKITNPFEYMID